MEGLEESLIIAVRTEMCVYGREETKREMENLSEGA